MHREWSIWVGFMAVVIAAVVFVLGRGDDSDNRSQLSAGTSLPTTTAAPSTTVPPTTTTSSSTTVPPDTTAPPTTRRATTQTTADDSPSPAPTAAPTTPAPTTPPTNPQPQIQFGPGTYRVGVDLPAGTYRTDGGPSCFWARLSSFGGTADSVIAGEYTDGAAATVTVQPTDAGFATDGCAVWLSV